MSTITAGTTSGTALQQAGDTTGTLVFKTNDTGSGGTTALTLGTDQSATFAGGIVPSGSTAPTNGMYLPAANTLGFATNSTQVAKIDSSGVLSFNSGFGSVAAAYACRAWVNFDATRDSSGATTAANTNRFIRASGNVASVLKNATGDYTITFTTALTDANYAVNLTSRITATGIAPTVVNLLTSTTPTASLFRICTDRNGVGPVDVEYIFASVFR